MCLKTIKARTDIRRNKKRCFWAKKNTTNELHRWRRTSKISFNLRLFKPINDRSLILPELLFLSNTHFFSTLFLEHFSLLLHHATGFLDQPHGAGKNIFFSAHGNLPAKKKTGFYCKKILLLFLSFVRLHSVFFRSFFIASLLIWDDWHRHIWINKNIASAMNLTSKAFQNHKHVNFIGNFLFSPRRKSINHMFNDRKLFSFA